MESANERGMRICLNPSPFNEKIEALPLDLAHWLFVNEIEGAALAKLPASASLETILEKLVNRFPAAEIILTAGKDGALYGFGETRARSEAVKVPAADTTGAGDTFTGFFLAAREKKMTVPQALAAACKAASIAVSRKGAMESIPQADEVFRVIDNQ
jgi:ribokinase